MRAVRAHDRDAPLDDLVVEEAPYPYAGEGDVVVKVRAACFTPGELSWPASWADRAGRPRSPVVPGHEVSGEVAEVALGTTGLTVGQRVIGLTDWNRDGTLAEYVAVEARNLTPLPADVDPVQAAALQGRMRPLVGSVRPLAEAPDAFRTKSGTAGKTVVTVA